MNNLFKVLKFEYLTYVKSKVYIITTALFMCLIILALNIPNFASVFSNFGGGKSESEAPPSSTVALSEKELVGIIDSENIYSEEILNQYLPKYDWNYLDSQTSESIENLIERDNYTFVLEIKDLEYTLTEKTNDELFTQGNQMTSIEDMISNTYKINLLLSENVSQKTIDNLLNTEIKSNYISVGKDISQSYWVGYALLMLLYFTILMYNQFIMTSVVTEKSSKAMEILITSVKPVYLMFGKVIGVGLAGLTQFGLIVTSALVTATITKGAWVEFSPEVASIMSLSISPMIFIYALIFFILGFFSFAFLYAGFASTISRMEEANSVALLPTLLFVAAFLVAMSSMSMPNATVPIVCSYLPFLSPLVMFMRVCVTDIPFYQMAICITVNIIYIILSGIASSRIYRAGVMMYGKPPSLIQMLKYVINPNS